MRPQTVERLWKSYAVTPTGCWEWTGPKQGQGYGIFGSKPSRAAHRAFYERFKGPIPAGLVIDHLCRNPSCVNPEHLEPVTNRENVMRGLKGVLHVQPSHCINGHEYTPENKLVNYRGHVKCRACNRDEQNARRRKASAIKRAAAGDRTVSQRQ